MNRRILAAAATGAMLLAGAGTFAQDQNETKSPMHMHESEMEHRSDQEVATEYKSEATQLREKAESQSTPSCDPGSHLPRGGLRGSC